MRAGDETQEVTFTLSYIYEWNKMVAVVLYKMCNIVFQVYTQVDFCSHSTELCEKPQVALEWPVEMLLTFGWHEHQIKIIYHSRKIQKGPQED